MREDFPSQQCAGVMACATSCAGVVDDYFGANFMDQSQANVSWEQSGGHGTGTAATLGGPNDGNPYTQLGVSPKVDPFSPCPISHQSCLPVAVGPSGACDASLGSIETSVVSISSQLFVAGLLLARCHVDHFRRESTEG